MIKATELRIGNAVLKQNKFHLVTVSNISSAASDLMIDYLNPIPITLEILEQYKKSACYGNIIKNSNEIEYILEDYEGNYVTDEPFEFIHQLQNLYFALTGEELTCTL